MCRIKFGTVGSDKPKNYLRFMRTTTQYSEKIARAPIGTRADIEYPIPDYLSKYLFPCWIIIPRYVVSTGRPKMSYIGSFVFSTGR